MIKTGEPYANWKDDGDFDAIVIGSGIGGLAAAALLAKHGDQKVLVLERHTKAGGFTHAYSRKDWDWDVGVHYIGQVHREGSMLRRLFDEVGDGTLQWEPMGEIYDTVVIGGQRWEYVTGREAWRDRMHLYFPDETEAIDRYLEQVREAIGGARTFFAEKALPRAAALVAGPWMRRRFLRHSERTLGEVLDDVTENPTMKAVLAAQFGDHGLPPSEASFVIHAMIFNHYLGGAAYPVGGASGRSGSRGSHGRRPGDQGATRHQRRRCPEHRLPPDAGGHTGARGAAVNTAAHRPLGFPHLSLRGARCN
jgi:all-trans-retinol 13,14-reductase